ncbi:hypothetical protein SEA_HUNTINGDON_53 [Arthrobacter phage Huntingdon]|uniref:Uncharacterized protein n=1 Tax=Arthrobacter phage Huntingdon TaxID=2047760 RepID=A0A2H4PAQ0_9CAUD|nr:hypothetical protein KDJ00_gp53 [Arthrobacter phage Huntingdon]AOQ28265.1 hypothetical protein SEA_RCIGASTRUGA_53 [Arthrobacter phage RcigaStruga]ATW59260.1 hypothetical protein SEA_HUNTINGDON_53 [Arthrobacter phage Huntingdon]
MTRGQGYGLIEFRGADSPSQPKEPPMINPAAAQLVEQLNTIGAELERIHEAEGQEPPLTTGEVFVNVQTGRVWFKVQSQQDGTELWLSEHKRHAAPGETLVSVETVEEAIMYEWD